MIKWKIIVFVFYIENFHISRAQHGVVSSKNLALNKPTSQSSTANFNSSLAVNGNYEDFSQTESSQSNWWRVSLGQRIRIAVIKVHNRRDCCQERLINVSILTSLYYTPKNPMQGSPGWTVRYSRNKFSRTFLVKEFHSLPIRARHVAVTSLANQPLSLSEVEVFGHSESTNVARGKEAVQFTKFAIEEFSADLAVNGLFDDKSLAASPATWEVDLGASYPCVLIRFFNGQNFTEDEEVNIKVAYKERARTNWEQLALITEQEMPHLIPLDNDHDSTFLRKLSFENLVQCQLLAIREVEVFARTNPAFRKPTKQLSTFKNYNSDAVVNGYENDYSFTNHVENPWWTVDLMEIYSLSSIAIRNRNRLSSRLASVLLYTSKTYQMPGNFENWTLINYKKDPYGLWETVSIPSHLREVRQIAIKINRTETLALGEVVVHEVNHANEREGVYQSSTYNNNHDLYGPEMAVDGLYNTTALSGYNFDDDQWWLLTLSKIILMTFVKIYFPSSQCRFFGITMNCVSFAAKVNISTSLSETRNDPSEWKLCHSQPYLQSPVQVGCDRNHRQPFTRHLIIQPQDKDFRIILKKVEVFGKDFPEFAPKAEAVVYSVSRTTAQLSFLAWNISNNGSFAPNVYYVILNDHEKKKVASHPVNGSGEITATLTNLDPGTFYKYEIACGFNEVQGIWNLIRGRFRTFNCTVPDKPKISWSEIDEGEKQDGINITVQNVDANCMGSPEYRVKLLASGSVLYNQHGQQHLVHVARDIDLKVVVMITNNRGMSNTLEKLIEALDEVPDKPELILKESNSSCIHIEVANKHDPLFDKLVFQFFCSHNNIIKENAINSPQNRTASQVFCWFSLSTDVYCQVTAENNIGASDTLYVKDSLPTAEARTRSIETTTRTRKIKRSTVSAIIATAVLSVMLPVAVITVCVIRGWRPSGITNKIQIRQTPLN